MHMQTIISVRNMQYSDRFFTQMHKYFQLKISEQLLLLELKKKKKKKKQI